MPLRMLILSCLIKNAIYHLQHKSLFTVISIHRFCSMVKMNRTVLSRNNVSLEASATSSVWHWQMELMPVAATLVIPWTLMGTGMWHHTSLNPSFWSASLAIYLLSVTVKMSEREGAIKTVAFCGIMLHGVVDGLLGQHQVSQENIC
jgi:hypothetical protein